MLTIAIVLVIAIITLAIGWNSIIPRILILYADFDYWWNVLRALPPEGEMYITVRGGPRGPFDKLLESVPTHTYDPKIDEFKELAANMMHEPKGWLAQHGLAYVGFNRSILMKKVRYDKYEKKPDSTEFGLVEKVRPGPSIFFQYNMGVDVRTGDKGNVPVSAIINLTLQIFGPRRALFLAGGWETEVVAGVQATVGQYIRNKFLAALREEKSTGNTAELIRLLTSDDSDGLNTRLKRHGMRIIKAELADVDEVADPETSKALKAKELADIQGDAKITEATKSGQAAVITAQKADEAATHTASAIKKVQEARVGSGGPHAGTFALAEAIPQFEGQTLVLGNVTGTAVPVGSSM